MAKKKQKKSFLSVAAIVLLAITVAGSILILLSHKPLPCANSISCINDLSGNYDPTKTSGEFRGQIVSVPADMLTYLSEDSPILGVQSKQGEKKIYVNLTTQQLYAYDGNKLQYTFTISSGKYNPTPVGKFHIWIKLLATNMEGGDKSDNTYYNLPNVPYTMYFYNENVGKWNGYGIHGAYWPMKFGQPDSQGCVVLRVADAAKLYRWADPEVNGKVTYASGDNPGTQIIIFGKAPM